MDGTLLRFKRLPMGWKSAALSIDTILMPFDDCELFGMISVPIVRVAVGVDSVTISSTICVESACFTVTSRATVRLDSLTLSTTTSE